MNKLIIHENIKNKLNYFYETNNIPHIIFHGSSGTGKKTLVFDFLNKIYNNDKHKLKTNVMVVNCSHGKGIKFIREDLKFFARTNIQTNNGVMFKSIVLLNADSLTNDAQSALRRCIEVFSYNTRFFIIVENKHKLLNPILSRFCEIYVPEYIVNNNVVNLHEYTCQTIFEKNENTDDFIKNKIETLRKNIEITHSQLLELSIEIYEKGYSCLDLINYIEKSEIFNNDKKSNILLCFYKIKSEYRCEKLLLLYMLDYIFIRENTNLSQLSFI